MENLTALIQINSQEVIDLCKKALPKIISEREKDRKNIISDFQKKYNNNWKNKKLFKLIRRKDISDIEAEKILKENCRLGYERDLSMPYYPSVLGYQTEARIEELLNSIDGDVNKTVLISSEVLQYIKKWAKSNV